MTEPHAGLAVCIARLQPVQRRQVDALRTIVERHAQVLVVCGGVTQPPSVINPWTLEERRAMLAIALAPYTAPTVLPVADCWYDDGRWAARVRAAVDAYRAAACIDTPSTAIYGLEREGPATYAALFPDWHAGVVDVPAYAPTLNEELLDDLPPLSSACVPHALRTWLAASLDTPLRRELREECRFVRRYRADWAGAPYTPIFVTVDALVTRGDRVLVIRRGRRPGLGQLALPGGFIDPHEFIRDSALRELREETGLVLSHADCRHVRVFDHPLRSLRGRIVTHLHRYVIAADSPLPAVRGGDDAEHATWLPIAAARAQDFFEDHYALLQVELDLP